MDQYSYLESDGFEYTYESITKFVGRPNCEILETRKWGKHGEISTHFMRTLNSSISMSLVRGSPAN